MTRVKLVNIVKRFGSFTAVDGVSVEMPAAKIFTLLGPSGCGKTTTLRLIAGFEYPDEGSIYFDQEEVTFKKPYERNTAMVFQNYALWPHMTVYENVAFGLKIRKLPKKTIDEKVKWALSLVGLEGLENRYPTQLSGGQQQRVALARALVVEPRVLLLDEPLSNLDAKLRLRMREEIRRLQRELGITTVYVTHDQEEAMTLSDLIAVMNKGRILQVGTPREVYNNPSNLFVATFIGRSTALTGIVSEVSGRSVEVDAGGGVRVAGRIADGKQVREGDRVIAIMRPEDFDTEGSNGDNVFQGRVEMTMFMGTFLQLSVKLANGQVIKPYVDPSLEIREGDEVTLYIPKERVIVYPIDEWEDEEFTLD
ncbi:MAG: ABC transporter ATP-binding protein [Desulfurococcales archaeon]|nr:ABC transporter ATP-binding protein [Desulfurococcales archaeon]